MGFKYRKRQFLAPAPSTSYIFAEVESSQNGEYKQGHNMLTIADCRRHIELEFFLGTRKARRQSLNKLDVLFQTLINFGQALNTQIELIENFEKSTEMRNGRRNKSGDGRAKKSRKDQTSKRVRKTSKEADQERLSG